MQNMPLDGIRIIECSSGLAGRLAGLLLADQGAIVVVAHDNCSPAALDDYLDRGKLRTHGRLPFSISDADVVIQDGLIAANRPHGQIRLAVTAAMPGETTYDLPDSVGDDVLKAIIGMYTDLAVTRRLIGDDVLYTPVQLCSIYAGLLGALAIGSALVERTHYSEGRDIVISRLAAGLSAIGALALEVDGLPNHLLPSSLLKMPPELTGQIGEARSSSEHFEWLKRRMNPFFACYPASDGRQLMQIGVVHRSMSRRLLDMLGIWEELSAYGMVDCSPYDPANAKYADRNIGLPYNLNIDLRMKSAELIENALMSEPALYWEEYLGKAGIACAMVRDFDEWRASDQPRQAGLVEKVPGCDWLQLGRAVRLASAKPYPSLKPLQELGPNDRIECQRLDNTTVQAYLPSTSLSPLSGIKVVDLTNVIAGPACGRILAELGATVIKVDSVRPEHTPQVMVAWPGETAQGKRSILLELGTKSGAEILHRLIKDADLVLFNKLDPVLTRLGLDRDGLAKINPNAIGVQLSAFKGERPSSHDDYPGYDPLFQAATGIMTRFGSADAPELHGVASCVDYLTGYLAAFGAVTALTARSRRLNGGGDWVDTSLVSAATLMQLSFQVKPAPVGTGECLRQVRDGWIESTPLY